jgi:cytoskeleton protein RodZ
MVLALALIVGYVVYHVVSSSAASPAASSSGSHLGASTTHKSGPKPASHPKTATSAPVSPSRANEVVIRLSANQNCWVELTTAGGTQIYQGVITAGNSMHWTEKQAVNLMLGNPGGVSLTVNGKNAVPADTTQPVTLSLGQGLKTSS